MGRRTVLLIAALVVAALGAALVWMYANRADERAQADAAPVEVLVATAGISAGTSGSAISQAGTAELRTLPAASVPAGALSDLTPVADLVTLGSVFPGQVLLQPMFGNVQEASGGLTLPPGTMAVAVQLGDPQRVAGFVQPGSEVAIFSTSEAEEGGSQTDLLLERVPVVAVGPTSVSTTTTTAESGSNTEEIPTAILTLAVDQEQAQKVILATSVAPMYFALLDKESKVDPDLAGTSSQTLLD